MIIRNNASANFALFHRSSANQRLGKSMEALSSGFRVNRSADDAAGLCVSQKMRAQICCLDQASKNTQDGISLLQTADGALGEVHSVLKRMEEISVYSANGVLTEQERQALNREFQQCIVFINDTAQQTEFNTMPILMKRSGVSGDSSVPAPALPPVNVTVPTTPIPLSGVDVIDANTIAITQSGTFQIPAGFTGTITVGDNLNVLISQSNSAQLNDVTISAGDNTTLHLKDLSILNTRTAFDGDNGIIKFTGSQNTLNLLGTNRLEGNNITRGLIEVSAGTTLDIVSSTHSGILKASASGTGATIGGADGENSGTINISSGIVEATAAGWGAAIGGGRRGTGDVNISGGTVRASSSGAGSGAAIGGGSEGSGGNITISGGIVEVLSEFTGAGIGGGTGGAGGNINITGGSVNIKMSQSYQSGAGMGGGFMGDGGTISLTGGAIIIDAYDSFQSAIGGGSNTPGFDDGGAGATIYISNNCSVDILNGRIGGGDVTHLGVHGTVTLENGTGGPLTINSQGVNLKNSVVDDNGNTLWFVDLGFGDGTALEPNKAYQVEVDGVMKTYRTNSVGQLPIYLQESTMSNIKIFTGAATWYEKDIVVSPSHVNTLTFYSSDRRGAMPSDEYDSMSHIYKPNNIVFQVGANRGEVIVYEIKDADAKAIGIAGSDVLTASGASDAMETVRKAILKVSEHRADIGALSNRMEGTFKTLGTTGENMTNSESRIRDTDMAKTVMRMTKDKILGDASSSMLTQANMIPQGVIQILNS